MQLKNLPMGIVPSGLAELSDEGLLVEKTTGRRLDVILTPRGKAVRSVRWRDGPKLFGRGSLEEARGALVKYRREWEETHLQAAALPDQGAGGRSRPVAVAMHVRSLSNGAKGDDHLQDRRTEALLTPCEGSSARPIVRARVQWDAGGIANHGLCESCGHLFSINKNGRLIKHKTHGCKKNLYLPTCRHKQRPQQLGTTVLSLTVEAPANLPVLRLGWDGIAPLVDGTGKMLDRTRIQGIPPTGQQPWEGSVRRMLDGKKDFTTITVIVAGG